MKHSPAASRPAPKLPAYLAVDTPDLDRARALCAVAAEVGFGVKIGKEFFTAHGPQGVAAAVAADAPLFLDLKWHDIPNTVAGALAAAARALRPNLVTVHASGGKAMMRAAHEAAQASAAPPRVIAVTVLTSLDSGDLTALGVEGTVTDQVERLARMAAAAGADGVVTSGAELDSLRALLGREFLLIVPGIRPSEAAHDDQKQVMTASEALAHGADYLVIGRAITKAAKAIEPARALAVEIAAARTAKRRP